MNIIPDSRIRIAPDILRDFVSSLALKSGMKTDNAELLADLLVKNDLRGVYSHGSRQIATYARIMRNGSINPNPETHMVSDSLTTFVVDGDGGLGYFPAYRAAKELIGRCKNNGVAVAVTRNHGHIGAAGLYSRMLAEQGLIGYVTSGHQLALSPGDSIMRASGGSPMSFAVPSGNAPDMVLDFGAMHDLYEQSPHVDELFRLAPGLVFRSMGLGFMCQALGGFLAGVPAEQERAVRQYEGANQGALIIALDISRFTPIESFKQEMDAYMRLTQQMQPMPGYERATLPGVLESEREREWSAAGIPLDHNHIEILKSIAVELGTELPSGLNAHSDQ
ncbi:MAG: hypothetical protein K0Q94_4806 [Paenibacillus sp.]|nr:hypothetical protein [Paenibacillus sp.]